MVFDERYDGDRQVMGPDRALDWTWTFAKVMLGLIMLGTCQIAR